VDTVVVVIMFILSRRRKKAIEAVITIMAIKTYSVRDCIYV